MFVLSHLGDWHTQSRQLWEENVRLQREVVNCLAAYPASTSGTVLAF